MVKLNTCLLLCYFNICNIYSRDKDQNMFNFFYVFMLWDLVCPCQVQQLCLYLRLFQGIGWTPGSAYAQSVQDVLMPCCTIHFTIDRKLFCRKGKETAAFVLLQTDSPRPGSNVHQSPTGKQYYQGKCTRHFLDELSCSADIFQNPCCIKVGLRYTVFILLVHFF